MTKIRSQNECKLVINADWSFDCKMIHQKNEKKAINYKSKF